jgi:lycopene cyclase domain-containing protein
MSSHLLYLTVDLGCILFPFIFSFYPKKPFYKLWRSVAMGTLAMMAVFIPWDMYFTHIGVWGFNPNYLLGYQLGNLPLEEILFFICIPYACIFTYEAIKYYGQRNRFEKWGKPLSIVYMFISILLIIFYPDNYYTLSANSVLLVLLFINTFVLKSRYMGWFHLSWIILLIPFYISNGILTGLDFTQYPLWNTHPEQVADQIVWYNNAHNLGIRIWSVPVDDFFYGMAMMLLAVTVHEAMQKKITVQPPLA